MRDDKGMLDTASVTRLGVGAALALGALFGVVLAQLHPAPAAYSAELIDPPVELAPFRLMSEDGLLTPSSLSQGWSLVFTGYTRCPDVCPTTLAQLAAAARSLNAPPRIIFATMDPRHDDLPRLTAYAAHFGDLVTPATGSREALEAFTAAFGFLAPDQVSPFDARVVAHSPTVVVVGPGAEIVARVRQPTTTNIVATIKRLRSQS